MAVPRGQADNFLIKAEKAANARGVRELGLVSGQDDGLGSLIDAVQDRRIKGLYLCGDDVVRVLDAPQLSALLEPLEFLIVQTLAGAGVRACRGAFPATTFAEKAACSLIMRVASSASWRLSNRRRAGLQTARSSRACSISLARAPNGSTLPQSGRGSPSPARDSSACRWSG